MCPLKPNMTVPKAVSVVAKPKDLPSNVLSVINNFNESTSDKSTSPSTIGKFAVCVKPLHFDYNKVVTTLWKFSQIFTDCFIGTRNNGIY